MVTPLALLGVERSGLCQNRHFASGYTSFSPMHLLPQSTHLQLERSRPSTANSIHPVPHPQHDHITQGPSQRPGHCSLLVLTSLWTSSHRPPRCPKPELFTPTTNLLLLPELLLSKGTTLPGYAPPSIYLLLCTSPVYPSTSHCHHPRPSSPAASIPPASLLVSYSGSLPTVIWPLTSSSYIPCSPCAGPLHMLIPCVQHL